MIGKMFCAVTLMDPLDIVFDILVSPFCSTLVPCLFWAN
jgi:hypothetical protein